MKLETHNLLSGNSSNEGVGKRKWHHRRPRAARRKYLRQLQLDNRIYRGSFELDRRQQTAVRSMTWASIGIAALAGFMVLTLVLIILHGAFPETEVKSEPPPFLQTK